MIANAEPEDEGVYTCQVITKLDMAEASGTLMLYGKRTQHPRTACERPCSANTAMVFRPIS